jgi:hypothetical protein
MKKQLHSMIRGPENRSFQSFHNLHQFEPKKVMPFSPLDPPFYLKSGRNISTFAEKARRQSQQTRVVFTLKSQNSYGFALTGIADMSFLQEAPWISDIAFIHPLDPTFNILPRDRFKHTSKRD